MVAKANSKPSQSSETELFLQIVTGFRGKLRILPNTQHEAFCKTSRKLKAVSLFLQKPLSWMFVKVLNILLDWLPKLRMFHF